MDTDLPYVGIVITLYEILVWFDWHRAFFCHHTLQGHTHFRLGYIEENVLMFEIGIAEPHQTFLDLFWGVRSSGGGYHIS